ncbi:fibrinogen C domain-containing protein 1 isoform X2 [Eupeodes corollae]|uniref:fibrinogen C domain-containing protein 1 isoform X2 n=1 Tax=Eupeodes corollae TaxID=290404 RepID=UPI0024917192|nr:fibrinogen C domain-containing protein 1 isoform X2 [Eupeodes corollae]
MIFRTKFLLLMAIVSICNANENPIYRRRELQQVRNNRSSHHAQVPISEMVTQIQERVSAMSTMDQTHLNKLESIENKLTQFDSSTIARLEAIRIQQQEMSKQLQNLDYVQRNTQAAVGDIRNEIDVMRYSMDHKQDEAASHVHARQANFGQAGNETDTFSEKLDSLAIFLASTRASVSRIENAISEFGTSLNKLTQLTRHQPTYNSPQYPQLYNSYGPPPPPPAFASEPSSCAQALLPQTGIQKIQVDPQSEPFYALCESADKGGWTVIQNRFDGSISFNRDWEEYKIGFGNLAGEFFIGMEKLHALTASTLHELMIVLVDFSNQTRTARYNSFAIAGEKEFYALHILGEYSGTAGDSLSFQAGNKFSTFDNDNDGWVEGNCAQAHTGAWWHAACEMSNLNGQYLNGDVDPSQQFQGMYWNDFHGPLYSLKSVQMKIRPIDQKEAF